MYVDYGDVVDLPYTCLRAPAREAKYMERLPYQVRILVHVDDDNNSNDNNNNVCETVTRPSCSKPALTTTTTTTIIIIVRHTIHKGVL